MYDEPTDADEQGTTAGTLDETAKKATAKKATAKKATAKKATAKKATAKKATAKKASTTRFTKRPFPATDAKEALDIPRVILEKHGGNPMDPAEVAAAIGLTKNSTRFFYLASAARDYGFTEGSRDTKTISVTPRGIAAIRPISEQEKRDAYSAAVNSIELFPKVHAFYKGGPLPEDTFLSSVLERQFHVDPKYHADFRTIYEANAELIGETTSEGTQAADSIGTHRDHKDVVHVGVTKFPHTAFVAMPFSEKGARPRPAGFFNQVIQSLITPAANAANFNVVTADRRGSDVIQATIVQELIAADLVIVDLTDHNPNVLFELGIRIAIAKPIILIRTKDTGQIFDVDNMLRVFAYSENLWPTTIAADVPKLTEFVKSAWDQRNSAYNYMSILAGESWKGIR